MPRRSVKEAADPEVLGLVERFRLRLLTVLEGPVKVVLFGSHARGEASPDSDIDVLVIVKCLTRETEDVIFEVAWQVGFNAGTILAVVPVTFDQLALLRASPFFKAVEAEGIAV